MEKSSLSVQVDAYCERTDFDFWSEPVNAVTNAAFIIAAIVGLIAARRAGRFDAPVLLLVALVFAIGTGSFLFHTLATRWAGIADVLPIFLFIVSYLIVALRRFFGLGWPLSVVIGLAYIPASFAITAGAGFLFGDALRGGTGYLPAFLALAICGALLAAKGAPAGRGLLIAAALFAVSLTFRTIDEPLCVVWPLGTHFVWHILNGTLLGLLLLTMIRHGVPKTANAD